MKYFIIFFLVSSFSFANEKKWAGFLTYSHLDLWLPGKIGAVASYGDQSRTFELAFQTASYSFDVVIDDLGRISDQRLHFSTRSFVWDGSFNIQYGGYYNVFTANLGNTYSDVLGVTVDVIEVSSLGVLWGLGNRWLIKEKFYIGADWFKVFWPLVTLDKTDSFEDGTASSEKDDLSELVDALANIPTFTLLHLEIGYRF